MNIPSEETIARAREGNRDKTEAYSWAVSQDEVCVRLIVPLEFLCRLNQPVSLATLHIQCIIILFVYDDTHPGLKVTVTVPLPEGVGKRDILVVCETQLLRVTVKFPLLCSIEILLVAVS